MMFPSQVDNKDEIKTEPFPHPSDPGSGSAKADGSLDTAEDSGIKTEPLEFNNGAKIKTEPPSQLNIIGEIIYESPIQLNHVISEFKTESPAQLNGELKRESPSHPDGNNGSKVMVYYMDSGEIKME